MNTYLGLNARLGSRRWMIVIECLGLLVVGGVGYGLVLKVQSVQDAAKGMVSV